MGCWDVYCIICGGPPRSPWNAELLAAMGKQRIELEWLDRHEGIPLSNIPRHLSSHNGQNIFAYSEQQTAIFPDSNDDPFCFIAYSPQWGSNALPDMEGDGYGVTCHQKCYQLLVAKLDYRLQIQDVWPLAVTHPGSSARVDWDYGGIGKYHCQEFLWKEMCQDGTSWMLLDFDESPENAARILNLWTPLVKSFKQSSRERFTEKNRSSLTALYCSFSRAQHLVTSLPESEAQNPLWHVMASVPSSVIHMVAMKAELAWSDV